MTAVLTVQQSAVAHAIMLPSMRLRFRLACAATATVLLGAAAAAGADAIQDFIRRHWSQPLAPQGVPPARFSPLEASLQPESCGTCHPAQLADWRESLHAAASGPGIAGQLVEMRESDPSSAHACLVCHAPLAEQGPFVAVGRELRENPAYDASLAGRGVPCAGCHVRGHQRFGPPRRDGSLASTAPRETLPHNGVTSHPAFLKADFCRGCHQFTPDGFALNGKLLQATYDEWKASRFAREGVQCQDCHMPDRRHRWRGIHDLEMVRSGLTIEAKAGAPRYRPGELALVTLRVSSTRVGHAFPTYVTPPRGPERRAGRRHRPGRRRQPPRADHRPRGGPRPLARALRHPPHARQEHDAHLSDEGRSDRTARAGGRRRRAGRASTWPFSRPCSSRAPAEAKGKSARPSKPRAALRSRSSSASCR